MPTHQNPKPLLFVFATLLVLILLSTNIWLLAGAMLLVCLGLFVSGAWAGLRRRLLGINLFILLACLPLAVVRLHEGAGLATLWSHWGISTESLLLSLKIFLRSSSASMLVLLALHQIPIYRLCQILRGYAVPSLVVELIELSYRYIHVLLDQGLRIYEAQTLRLGYQGWGRSSQHTAQLFAQSFVLAHSESEHMYDGLLTRQFDEGKPTARATSHSEGATQTPKYLLELQSISYRYEGAEADSLIDLHLCIGKGERIALLGANGSGKSTLMRLLAGLQRERSGLFLLDGSELDKSRSSLRQQRMRIGLVMQNANHQLFCPSVADELAFGLRNSGLTESEVERKVEELILCYGLQELRDKAPHLLSEGQKKWVSIAAVMALEPEILMMDEPTACLDSYYTRRVLELCDACVRAGRTLILSTHDMNLAYDWADRALVMNSGHLVYDGAIAELFGQEDYYLNAIGIVRPYGFCTQAEPLPSPSTSGAEHRLGLFHSVERMPTLVVGGGRGAERKVQTLLTAGVGSIDILSPELSPKLHELLQSTPSIRWHKAQYPEGRGLAPLERYALIIAATGNSELDESLCHEAVALGRLCASVGRPELGNVQFAAQLDRVGIQLAVHSSYALPRITQLLRDLASKHIDESWQADLERLSQLRKEQSPSYPEEERRMLERIRSSWS